MGLLAAAALIPPGQPRQFCLISPEPLLPEQINRSRSNLVLRSKVFLEAGYVSVSRPSIIPRCSSHGCLHSIRPDTEYAGNAFSYIASEREYSDQQQPGIRGGAQRLLGIHAEVAS